MRLLVTDIDETLSVGETVSAEVRDACACLRRGGWDIMIATGRIFGAARKHMEAASVSQPSIFYDGCRLMDLDGTELHSTLLSPALAMEILEFLWPLPLEFQIAGDEAVCCRESDLETIRFYRQSGVPIRYVSAPFAEEPVYRIGLWLAPEKLPAVVRQLKDAFGCRAEVSSGGTAFADILPKGVSKGAALERFIATLPERPEIVVAAGDNENDLTMLRFADMAAVPRNAAPALLPLAGFVMPTALEHGLGALAEYLLSSDFQF
ncbi:MAG: Cof-type HAD-IIB family hydrolase [Synergistaceae bacterium]|jgi:Cof subfamily protein (haloacid dehalogenase superfamily)|nr:Cof-type HAD-IIB family hydrolase [Synergistaceae bacterium]